MPRRRCLSARNIPVRLTLKDPLGLKTGRVYSIPTRPLSRTRDSFFLSKAVQVICTICRSTVSSSEAVRVPCGHHYDFDCLSALFIYATKDESLLPARCCQKHIPLDLVRPHLTEKQAIDYSAKEREHATPNRLYCPKSTCSAFLGPAEASRGVVSCTECNTRVCAECKSFEHPLGGCHPDSGDAVFLDLATRKGYRRCPKCRRFTELAHGCNHMYCACQAEFCYKCGVTWKKCKCLQWDENLLFDRAEEQVQLQYGVPEPRAPPAQVQVHQQRVRRAAADLRDNHDCQHGDWRVRSGANMCQECWTFLDRYLLVSLRSGRTQAC
ncbi:hypothetical protein JAAARDRAFT_121226 [Jaapia argillacea MUCL 33604]|uniref:RBR-type E3 ubiquitin transferase n=1 Tax=Jaapia argillacea MUCL 33604 TaxID=933084 RepID=A0A067Q6X6_9AGAM|nr:hypothetical protein JAAARDRAFT_121226 [Jaapia argillacea MUCL 33604]